MARRKKTELVIAETHDTDVVNDIFELQQQIIKLTDSADSITSKALSNAKTSDLTEYQETLVAAIMAIQEATATNLDGQSSRTGFMGFILDKVQSFGFAKKIQKSVKEKYIENASLQENIDTIFESLEDSIQATERDIDTLAELKESLIESTATGTNLVSIIENAISKLSNDDDDLIHRAKLEGLLRELKSINLVNANTANQISAQIATTGGLAQNLREVRPILKNLIKSQTLVALQNARLGQAREVRDLVSGVVNDFVTINNAATQSTILDAIEYSGKTIIAKETVEDLGAQHTLFIKELKHIATNLNKQKLDYIKTVDAVTAQLNTGLKELPRLMVGDTSQVTKPKSESLIGRTRLEA